MTAAAPAAVVLGYLAFVAIGVPDGVLGTAWPSLRADFAWPQSGLGLILTALAAGYLLAANATGALLARSGIGLVLILSTAVVAGAALLFAFATAGVVLLLAALLTGLGSATVDTGLNAHAARHFSARHLNWMHAAYGLGAALGPLLMTAALAATGSWRSGYLALGAGLAALALVFAFTRERWTLNGAVRTGASRFAGASAGLGASAALQVVAFFLYTGVEAGAGQWAFTVLREGREVPLAWAGFGAATFWAALFGGRILTGLVAERFTTDALIRAGALGTLAGAVLFMALPGAAGLGGLVVMGLALAPIFPSLMRRTAERFAATAATRLFGLQVSAAMLGALAVPALGGVLADLTSLEAVPGLLAIAASMLGLVLAALRRLARASPT